ncbi:unnamed protein product [Rangifer tarandus platyrhynchus]|uniref:Uncharacterized protein n=1 Tax=Rangifer tarandus platyrhynchus TaxID=3082113 RepID=A0AC59YPF2_RANTA
MRFSARGLAHVPPPHGSGPPCLSACLCGFQAAALSPLQQDRRRAGSEGNRGCPEPVVTQPTPRGPVCSLSGPVSHILCAGDEQRDSVLAGMPPEAAGAAGPRPPMPTSQRTVTGRQSSWELRSSLPIFPRCLSLQGPCPGPQPVLQDTNPGGPATCGLRGLLLGTGPSRGAEKLWDKEPPAGGLRAVMGGGGDVPA